MNIFYTASFNQLDSKTYVSQYKTIAEESTISTYIYDCQNSVKCYCLDLHYLSAVTDNFAYFLYRQIEDTDYKFFLIRISNFGSTVALLTREYVI